MSKSGKAILGGASAVIGNLHTKMVDTVFKSDARTSGKGVTLIPHKVVP